MAKKITGTKWKVATTTRKRSMNLRLFAEEAGPSAGTGQTAGSAGNEPTSNEPTGNNDPAGSEPTSDIMTQLAALKAENAKLKNTNDKLCQSEGQLRKQLREKMTAEEKAAEIKAQEETAQKEYVAGLEKELAIIKSTARYIEMGFDADMAAVTAAADYDGDKDTVNANIQKMLASQRKKMEAEIREKLLKEIPAPQSGSQSNVDYSKQIKDAISTGDLQSAALAILQQADANRSTT